MKSSAEISFATTNSVGVFLHWMTHYLQSPVTATAGYLEMALDNTKAKSAVLNPALLHMLTEAQGGVDQINHVLSGVVLVHTYLQRSPVVCAPSDLSSCLRAVSLQANAQFTVQRSNNLPNVVVQEELFCVSLTMLCQDVIRQLGGKNITLSFRQRKDELIIHMAFSKRSLALCSALARLLKVPTGEFALPSGSYIPLAAATSVLRLSGASALLRPTKPGKIDIYVHVPVARQLQLDDMIR